ncbi:MAG: archaellin/type IV pilin N-terminal domain-containing protein [Candidatus Aenigmatarchaeota archaeon]
MESKAISPMIASVLLIAFTIAVGGILSLWMTGFTTTTTSSVETASINQTKCAGTYIDILSVSDWVIIYTNRGSQTISSIVGFTDDGSSINITATGSSSLTPGQSASIRNHTEATGVTNETINFAANNTYYNFANSPVTSVGNIYWSTDECCVPTANYAYTTTQIRLYTNSTVGGYPNITTGNYKVNYVYTTATKTPFYRGGNTSVTFTGKCLGIGVTGQCKSGQSCWK